MVLRGEASEADLPTVAAVRDGSTPANWNPRQRGGVVAWREACAVGRGSRRARRTAAHLAALCLKLKAFRLAGRPHRAMAPWSFLTISRRDAALPWDGPTPGSAPLQGDSPRSGVPYRGSAPQRRSWRPCCTVSPWKETLGLGGRALAELHPKQLTASMLVLALERMLKEAEVLPWSAPWAQNPTPPRFPDLCACVAGCKRPHCAHWHRGSLAW